MLKWFPIIIVVAFSCACSAGTYSTRFTNTENPISEGGRWINGKTTGLDWSDVETTNSVAIGLESGNNGFDDSTALLTGSWGTTQSVTAVVYTTNQSSSLYEEVEIRLRSSLSAHSCTGYEVNFSLRPDNSAYTQIVRWNGPLADYTYVAIVNGANSIITNGTTVMAVVTNDTISAFINGVMVVQGVDTNYPTGSPGMGFFLSGATGVNNDYGFTSFTASDGLQTNPAVFSPVAGAYSGLFCETNGAQQTNSGAFSLNLTKEGTYSARVFIGSARYPCSGRLSSQGGATNVIARRSKSPLSVSLQMGTGDQEDQLSGLVTDGTFSSPILAYRYQFNSLTNPAPWAGAYTLIFPQDPNASLSMGDGYASGRLSSSGLGRLVGTLPDGTHFAQSAPVSKQGLWPVYVSLYGGKGSLLSWLAFSNGPATDLSGISSWLKPADPRARLYPSGVTYQAEAIGSAYVRPTTPQNAILLLSNGNCSLAFTGGDIDAGFTNLVSVGPSSHVSNSSSNHLNMRFSLGTGTFAGNVADPLTGRSLHFGGAVLQKINVGLGLLSGTDQTSLVVLSPTAP